MNNNAVISGQVIVIFATLLLAADVFLIFTRSDPREVGISSNIILRAIALVLIAIAIVIMWG